MATEKPVPTVEDEFEIFLLKCYDGERVDPNKKQHLRMAFYAGTLSNIAYVVETCKGEDANEVVRVLLARLSECHQFMMNRVANDFVNKLLSSFTTAATIPKSPTGDVNPRRN